MRPAQRYHLYGLQVESQLPLHQNRIIAGDGPPDVVLTIGDSRPVPKDQPDGMPLADVTDDDGTRFFTFVRCADGSYVLRYYRICDFVVSADLARVVLHQDPDADPGFAAVLAAGSLPAFLILAGGSPLLHASAVEIDGHALAFVGASGMGKSTMATIMCASGGKLITDDVLRLDLDAGSVRCILGGTETRLRKSAVELMTAFGDEASARRTSDERDALGLPPSRTERLPLDAIVVPQPATETDEVTLQRLSRMEALLTLSRFPRIVGWEEASVLRQQFEFLADIVDRVPVFVGSLPWGPPFAPDLAARVLAGIDFPTRHQASAFGSR
ncbi:MAG: hypothetical protein QOJ62_497 [Actinomycetota bacterium]|nr:hypothetical protein [Actinomycetota bacterium]